MFTVGSTLLAGLRSNLASAPPASLPIVGRHMFGPVRDFIPEWRFALGVLDAAIAKALGEESPEGGSRA
jgi:hypothetical protein